MILPLRATKDARRVADVSETLARRSTRRRVPPVDALRPSPRTRTRTRNTGVPGNRVTTPHRAFSRFSFDSVRPAHGGGHERRFYRKVYAARSNAFGICSMLFGGGRPRPRRSSQNQARKAWDGTHIKLDARMTSTPMVAQNPKSSIVGEHHRASTEPPPRSENRAHPGLTTPTRRRFSPHTDPFPGLLGSAMQVNFPVRRRGGPSRSGHSSSV